MRKVRRLYLGAAIFLTLTLASCNLGPETRGAGLECEGGIPETELVYDEEGHLIAPIEIWGRGWNKMPDIDTGNGRVGVQFELRRSYVHKLTNDFAVGTWSGATHKTDFWRFSTTTQDENAEYPDVEPRLDIGGENEESDREFCRDTEGNIYSRQKER